MKPFRLIPLSFGWSIKVFEHGLHHRNHLNYSFKDQINLDGRASVFGKFFSYTKHELTLKEYIERLDTHENH